MKAAIKTGYLGTTISFSNEVASPKKAAKDSVLVKAHAAAINPIDYKLPKLASGLIAGLDFCGEVVEDSHGFSAGDLVFGRASKGSLAEYTLAPVQEICKVPSGWSATDCAALPIAYWSALQSLKIGNIQTNSKEKSVLVIGASGGCGLAGAQLCAAMGVSRIVGICSDANSDFVAQHGVTEVVNYRDADALETFFQENQGKFDCVYDTATYSGGGADYWKDSIGLLKRDSDNNIIGEYTSLNGPPSKWMRAIAGAQTKHETIVMMEANGSELAEITEWMDKTNARPITNIFPFDEEGIKEGFKLLKSRRTKGKIVFDVLGTSEDN